MKEKQINWLPVLTAFLLGSLVSSVLWLFLMGGISSIPEVLKFAQLLELIDQKYIGDYDLEEVTDAALEAAVDSLEDRWSYYMDEETYAYYTDYSKNEYSGIGIQVKADEETGGFLVVGVFKDQPADLAGIVSGDIIVGCDGEDLRGTDLENLTQKIQDAFGSTVVLRLLKEDGAETEVEVSCEKVYVDPVSYEMLEDNIAYIRIENFESGAGENACKAVEELIAQGAESLIFDVRGNPGGYVTEMCKVLDLLLPEGKIFVQTDRKGKETYKTSDADWIDLPIAVLIDGESYSAAEYFAAALEEMHDALTVGTPSTGKARSQQTFKYFDNSAVHISTRAYCLPSGRNLAEEGGLIPQLEIQMDEETQSLFDTGWLEVSEDPQIAAAAAALQGN